MQAQNYAHVLLALRIVEVLLVVSLAQEGEGDAVAAEARLDDVGDIVLVRLLVVVGEILAARLLMAAKVVIGAVGDAPQLAPVGKREGVLDIRSSAGVERQLRRLVVAQSEVFVLYAEALEPVYAVVLPVREPLKVGARLAEELALHLLKLAGAEGEVSRRYLVAERLADLADAEGQLAAGRALDVREVYEYALRRLRAEVHG